MLKGLNNFICDEDGAVTIDWVVICAAVVALAVGTLAVVGAGIFDITAAINSVMEATF